MTDNVSKKGFHYGYLIVAACVMCAFGPVAMALNSAGIYFTSIAGEFGVGKGEISNYFTFLWLAATISLPFAGNLFAKFDARICTTVCTLLIGCSLIGMSFAQTPWQIYVGAFVNGCGISTLLFLMTPTLINRWFAKRSGFMIGIAMAFTGIGAALWNMVGGMLINANGWRFSWMVFGIVALVFTLPFTVLVVRSDPSDKGLKRAFEGDADAAGKVATAAGVGMPANKACKTLGFVLILVFTLLINLGIYAYQMTPSYISSLPIGLALPLLASTISSFYMVGQVVAKIILGATSEKQPVVTGCVALVLGILGVAGYLAFVGSDVLLIASAVLLGFFGAITNVLLPSVTTRLYGTKDYSKIYSRISLAASVGSMLQAPLLGRVIDTMGFGAMYTVIIVLFVLAMVSLVAAVKAGDAAKKKCVEAGEWTKVAQ